jgi:hypothetical protein
MTLENQKKRKSCKCYTTFFVFPQTSERTREAFCCFSHASLSVSVCLSSHSASHSSNTIQYKYKYKYSTSTSMGLFGSVKHAARKTKLQGELMLIERELESLQKRSGAELFTVLYDWEQQQLHAKYDNSHLQPPKEEQPLDPNDSAKDAAVDATVTLPVPGLTLVYQAAREDIMDLVARRQHKVEEVDVVEVQMENIEPAVSAKTKAQNASTYVRHAASLAKLQTSILHLEREIYIRKQIFGVQVFREIDLYNNNSDNSNNNDNKKNVLQEQLEAYNKQAQGKNGGNNTDNQQQQQQQDGDDNDDDEHYESLSPNAVKVAKPPPRRTDQDIFALLHRITLSMDPILERKRAKQQEIAALRL